MKNYTGSSAESAEKTLPREISVATRECRVSDFIIHKKTAVVAPKKKSKTRRFCVASGDLAWQTFLYTGTSIERGHGREKGLFLALDYGFGGHGGVVVGIRCRVCLARSIMASGDHGGCGRDPSGAQARTARGAIFGVQ